MPTFQEHRTPPEQSPSPTPAPTNMSPDWDRNALFEKMVRIQRDNARKSEKIDFLEEHVQDLVAEVKKKNRIIQFYFAKEDSGSMATEASDRHKVSGPLNDTIFRVTFFRPITVISFIILAALKEMKLLYQVT